jgi:hypothetical protein
MDIKASFVGLAAKCEFNFLSIQQAQPGGKTLPRLPFVPALPALVARAWIERCRILIGVV